MTNELKEKLMEKLKKIPTAAAEEIVDGKIAGSL